MQDPSLPVTSVRFYQSKDTSNNILLVSCECLCVCVCAHEQSHIIAHSQGLTNGLSDRDYRVLTISLFYVQNKYITWNIKIDKK